MWDSPPAGYEYLPAPWLGVICIVSMAFIAACIWRRGWR